MIRKNPSGDLPVIAESAYVDKTAIICGKVVIGENVFVGPYAVIRADEVDDSGEMEPITIGANCANHALGLTAPQSCPIHTARVSRLPFCWMPVALKVPLTLVVNSRSLRKVATPVPWAFGQLKRNFH